MRPTACSAGSWPASCPSTRLHEDDLVIAIRDIAPRAPTHILLIPRRHIASALDLTETDGPLLGRHVRGRGGPRPVRGHRRRRVPAGLERRAMGRPVGGPPARPPHGRSLVRMAAGLTRRRDRGPRSRSLGCGAGVAGCAPDGRRPLAASRPAVASVGPARDGRRRRSPRRGASSSASSARATWCSRTPSARSARRRTRTFTDDAACASTR